MSSKGDDGKGKPLPVDHVESKKRHNAKNGKMVYPVYRDADSEKFGNENTKRGVNQIVNHSVTTGLRLTNSLRKNRKTVNQVNQINQSDPVNQVNQTMTTEEQIIFCAINQPKTMNQISIELNVSKQVVSNAINRKQRNTGLLVDGYLDKKVIDGKDYYYVATEKGRNLIESIIQRERDKAYRELEHRYRKRIVEEKIDDYEKFIRKNYYAELMESKNSGRRLIFDFRPISQQHLESSEDMLDDPEEEIKIIKAAIESIDREYKGVQIGFTNIPGSQRLKIGYKRSRHIGGLYVFEGVIKQTSTVKPKASNSHFECPTCGTVIPVIQLDNKFREPTECGCGRKGRFRLKSTEMRDFQVLKLEEQSIDLDGRTQAEEVDIMLYDDLTRPSLQLLYNPGKNIRIIGILKSDFRIQGRFKSTEQILYVEAINVEPFEEQYDFKLTETDIENVKKLSTKKDIINLLTKSVAPDIYGYNLPKKAFLCQAVGGGLTDRKEIHQLWVGDPGMGKTKLAEKVQDLVPNSRFMSGTGASGVGLSATVRKDEFSGLWSIVAGALPLAHKSLAICDELDKMKTEELNSLHDALEQQKIFVNKAGLSATLRCETSLLATANPKFGRFENHESYLKQIALSPPLLSRFDLIFCFVDDEKHDKELANFLLDLSTGQNNNDNIIERSLLRKYLAYARSLKPKLNGKNKERFIEKYLELRQKSNVKNVTIRQFQAMQRIAAALAKLRLSEKIILNDIEGAVDLVVKCYDQLLGNGKDLDILNVGIGSDKRKIISAVLGLIPERGESASFEFITESLKLSDDDISEALEYLKSRGEIHEPRASYYQRV